MASYVRSGFTVLKRCWDKEPVLVVSCVLGFSGPLFIFFGPGTKDFDESRKKLHKFYPVPIRRPEDPKFTD